MTVDLGKRTAAGIAAGIALADTTTSRLATSGLPLARAVGAGREDIRAHVASSPHLRDGVFHNLDPASEALDGDFGAVIDMVRRPGRPRRQVRVITPDFHSSDFDDARGPLAATWLGHATVLVELDGVRILTDPVLSRRCSPSRLVGPLRMHPAPTTVAALPTIDIVLISHDHYDHLDYETVTELAATQPEAVFVCPLGVGAHLRAWGIAADRIRQGDWDERVSVTVDGRRIDFDCCPARHFSGRFLTRNTTQWASWGMSGPSHRVFFSGDTGFSERFADFGRRVGPFDLTLIAIGAYDRLWPEIHVDPEEAMAIHRMLSGDAAADSVMIPIHWGTFNLARHTWGDPVARVLPAAQREASTVLVPPPGGRIDLIDRVGSGMTDPAWWELSA